MRTLNSVATLSRSLITNLPRSFFTSLSLQDLPTLSTRDLSKSIRDVQPFCDDKPFPAPCKLEGPFRRRPASHSSDARPSTKRKSQLRRQRMRKTFEWYRDWFVEADRKSLSGDSMCAVLRSVFPGTERKGWSRFHFNLGNAFNENWRHESTIRNALQRLTLYQGVVLYGSRIFGLDLSTRRSNRDLKGMLVVVESSSINQ